eukprot:gene23771-9329_t
MRIQSIKPHPHHTSIHIQVLICSIQPQFSVVSTVSVGETISMEWALRQLYILTPTEVLLVFVSAPPVGSSLSVGPSSHIVKLAVAGLAACPALPQLGSTMGILPSPFPRPPGLLALLGPRDGALWLINVYGQPVALQLTHPGLRACCLIASGDTDSAVALASSMLPPSHHDQLASFLTDMDGMTGAASALSLPGLTLPSEAKLRMQARQWRQTLEAVEALLAGYTHRPPPGQFTYTAAAAAYQADTATTSFRPQTVYGAYKGSLDPSLFAAPAGIDPPDEVDWTKPVRDSSRVQGFACCAPKQPGLGIKSNKQQRMGADLGLQLLGNLMPAGLHDVARHVATLLMKHSKSLLNAEQLSQLSGYMAQHSKSLLNAEQLSQLSGYMAQVGMRTELHQGIALQMVPGAEAVARETVGLIASMLSANATSTQVFLQQSDSIALATTHSEDQIAYISVSVSGAEGTMDSGI